MCKRIFKEQTSEEGEVPFYKIGTFGGIPDAYITRELFEEYKKNYQYPNKGDILISASGSIGRTVEYTGKDEYYQDSNIVWLKHENDLDNSFLKVLYGVIEWSCEGSTIKRLYNYNFLKTEFMLPKIDPRSISVARSRYHALPGSAASNGCSVLRASSYLLASIACKARPYCAARC